MTDDPQRAAVYAAEDSVIDLVGPRLRRWTDVEGFLRSVLLSADYEAAFPEAPIDVEVQRRTRSATASLAIASSDLILIRDGSWNAVTVLHELAHLVAPGTPAHGPRFVAAELELVRQRCGFQAYATLRTAFRDHGVEIFGVPHYKHYTWKRCSMGNGKSWTTRRSVRQSASSAARSSTVGTNPTGSSRSPAAVC